MPKEGAISFTDRELHQGEFVPIAEHTRKQYTGQGFIGTELSAWRDLEFPCPSRQAAISQVASNWVTTRLPNNAGCRFGLATCTAADCDYTVPVRVSAKTGELVVGH